VTTEKTYKWMINKGELIDINEQIEEATTYANYNDGPAYVVIKITRWGSND